MTAVPALYRIAAAARLTGVPDHTLRVWERRYGALASHRTEAGYRLFTNDDLERVRLLKTLLDEGHAIGDIAKLPTKELVRLRRAASVNAPVGVVVSAEAKKRFLAAVDAFDVAEAARVLAAARAALSPFDLVEEIVAPLLGDLGKRWEDRPNDSVAQEHAATVVLRDELMTLLATAPRGDRARVIVATPSGELHEFGGLIAAVVAAHAGARVLYLGPNLPAADLANAAKKTRADVVLLSFVSYQERMAVAYAKTLRKELPRQVQIWAGGAALPHGAVSELVAVSSLAELRRKVERTRGA